MKEEEFVKIPKWQFENIEDVLRMANNIHHSHLKETCFDRCIWKSWGWARKALGMTDVIGVNIPNCDDKYIVQSETLGQYFDNHFDCYTDTWEKDRLGNMVEGKITPAMTKDAAIKFALQFDEDFKTKYYEDKLERLIRQINSLGEEINELKRPKQ